MGSTLVKDNNDIKFRFTLIIMNWIRLHWNDDSTPFPSEIIQLIVDIFLYEKIQILQFNEEFKHPDVALDDDKRCAKSTNSSFPCSHVMVDCDPVASGLHVWRIQVLPNIFTKSLPFYNV